MNRLVSGAAAALLLLSIGATSAPAQSQNRPLAAFAPEDGDRIVFIGDSITYQTLYTRYFENYFYTRFPGTRLHFHNVGVGGDTAGAALARFDKTVATIEPAPAWAFVMLGMNDGRYQHFNPGLFANYERDMTLLIERLESMGTKIVLVSPPYFDWRFNGRGRPIYYNGVLAFYSSWLRETAMERGHGFVDVNGPMADLVLRQRKTDPAFNLAKDGIHPEPHGQMVMAVEILTQMGAPSVVTRIDIDREGARWSAQAVRGRVDDLRGGRDGLTFTFAAEALPWTPTSQMPGDGPTAADGYALTGASTRLNREVLRVGGLDGPGVYELRIDGDPVGRFTGGELAAGVELQDNAKTPQYKHAAAVVAANDARNGDHVFQYVKAWLMHLYHEKDRLYLADAANAGNPDYGERKAEYEKWYDVNEKHKAASLAAAIEEEAAIYAMNKPEPRKYEVRRVGGGR